MRTNRLRRSLILALLGVVMCPLAPHRAGAQQFYEVGDVVSDFTLYARRAFTNDAGQVVAAGSPVRLTDFEGKIVFLEFYYVW